MDVASIGFEVIDVVFRDIRLGGRGLPIQAGLVGDKVIGAQVGKSTGMATSPAESGEQNG